MKNVFLLLLATLFSTALIAQKFGNNSNADRSMQVTTLNTNASVAYMQSRVNELARITPTAINLVRERSSSFIPMYFEVYPNPAHEWLACDYPANSNILYVQILDVAGQVIASYHRWDRLFYIGNLESGLYQIQIVQNNFIAQSTSFYKR